MVEIDIIKETCCSCKIPFWITEGHHKQLLNSKDTFYCPNGHGQNYQGESEYQKRLEREKELEETKKKIEELTRKRDPKGRYIKKKSRGKQ